MEVVKEDVEARSYNDSEYRAIVVRADVANCQRNPPMHQALEEIKVSFHPARKTRQGFEVLFSGKWFSVAEFDDDDDVSEFAIEILEPGERLTKEVIDDVKLRIWLRFARHGVL
jgi:hypothetical protein